MQLKKSRPWLQKRLPGLQKGEARGAKSNADKPGRTEAKEWKRDEHGSKKPNGRPKERLDAKKIAPNYEMSRGAGVTPYRPFDFAH